MEAEIHRITEHVAELEGTSVCSRASSCAPACVRDFRGWVSSVHADSRAREALQVGWRIDKQISKRHCVRVDIEDDSKIRTFEGDHFKCAHGEMASAKMATG